MAIEGDIADCIAKFVGDDAGRSVAVYCAKQLPDVIGANIDLPRPAASIIKVATVMALFDLDAAGRVDLAEQVSVRALGDTRYCSILKAFDPDRQLSLREIVALSLIASDNPASVHVMSRLGFFDVNEILAQAGCSQHAVCAVGFSEDELGRKNRANTLTARDAVKLFRRLDEEPRYRPIVTFLENNLRNARIPALLPEDVLIAHKTGSLDGVVNDAGLVTRGDNSFVVAFLCDGQPDPLATQNDMAACSLRLFELLVGRGS